MKLTDIETFVVGTPPPHWGGQFWVFVKITTDSGISGIGEAYGVPFHPDITAQMIRDVFERRLREEASQVAWASGNLPDMKLLAMKKQWESCSQKGRIHLNPQLVKAPRECIDYVILHELCHLKEHNHSPRFYGLLDRNMPDWRERKAKLDGMAELLLNR